MPSERHRPPLVRLADVLAEATGGVRPTALELAELLWLARRMEQPEETGTTAAPKPTPEAGDDVRLPDPPPVERREEPPATTPPPPRPPRAPLHLPTRAPEPSPEPHAALLAPAPPMLHHPLALQRSLRPLKRRTAAPDRLELDERATADRIARLGAEPEWWLPVLRPAQERWLSLALIHDTGPTMPVWRPLIRELHTTLAQSGIFRTVTIHGAGADGRVRTPDPADGRTVTLLISDCMGPQWRAGPAGARWYDTLRRWSGRMPLAVVQPLPEHLWRDTALPTTAGLVSAPHPAAPNSALSFTPYDDVVDGAAVPLPVLEPGPRWLANWAGLVAAPGGQRFPGAVGWLGGPADTEDRTDIGELSAEELVLRFRAAASPEAFRLAGHLALGRPDLPVMRLVQAALERRPRPQHLAEVILSGMVTGVAGPPGSYAFRSGVRELLVRSLPRTARRRTTDLLSRLGALIDERAGVTAGEIHATTPMSSGTVTAPRSEPIATVAEETRDLLVGAREERRSRIGTRYRLLRRLGPGSLWYAEDTELRRPVLVRVHSAPSDPARLEAFLRDARILASVHHPNVVAVLDYGITEPGEPYVVMEHLDGIALNSLASPGGYRLPTPLLVSLGRQLADALSTIHDAGVAHGGLGMTRVMLLPDGTAKLTLFQLGAGRRSAYSADLRALGELIFQLSAGRPVAAGTPVDEGHFYGAACRALLHDRLPKQQEGLRLLRLQARRPQERAAYEPLHYGLLGPVQVLRTTARPLATGSPQEQAMLAMLLLHHGREVTHAQLTEGIWGRKPPSRSDALLGTYASRLRNALGPGVLATLSGGYALHTSVDFVDVIHCQQLVDQAETERSAGDPVAAREAVQGALNLWRGEALADVPGPAAASARTGFHQLRLSLCTTRAELDLEVGEFEQARTDLAGLVHTHPSREDFRRLYLIALQRQGRMEEALEVFEEYEMSGGDNPELLALGHELREALEQAPESDPEEPTYGPPAEEDPPLLDEDEPDRLLADEDTDDEPEVEQHDFARYEFTDGRPGSEAMAALRRLVGELVRASGLAPGEYQLVQTDQGVTARVEPYVDGAPLFRATLGGLSAHLPALGDLRLAVTFWQAHLRFLSEVSSDRPDFGAVRSALRASEAQAIVALSDFWHDVEVLDGEAADPRDFHRLDGTTGWYRLFDPPDRASVPAEGRAVRGPFRMPYDGRIPGPTSPDKVVVLSDRDGALFLADAPTMRQSAAVPLPEWHYFEVDLRERHLSLSDAPGVSVAWRVDDPLKAAASPGLDLPRMLNDVFSGARRGDRDSLTDTLARWRVPGYALRWTVPPGPTRPAVNRSATEVIRAADYVLLGFDEVFTRLYPGDTEREVLRDIARMLVAERDPEDALAGRPLLPAGGPIDSIEGYAGSLDLLRAFAGHELEREVRALVDSHDIRAARDARRPHPLAADLLKALRTARVATGVVGDRSIVAMERYLTQHRLNDQVPWGVYGRTLGSGPLMPHPHVLLKALDHAGVLARAGVLVASTVAELTAARGIGLPFIGCGTELTLSRLRAADPDVLLVPSLLHLVEAAHSRPT
ncbi:SAV_2336 N-terminal domain-related protein [Streptomyces sp. NPDC003635]